MRYNQGNSEGDYINQYLVMAFKKLGKTQGEIISDLGKSQPYVSALMNGKKKVGKEVAQQLHDLYGFDKGAILSEKQLYGEQLHTEKAVKSYKDGRPYFEGDWELGFKDSFDENLINPEYNIDFPPANNTDGFWMRGRGKSMLGEVDPGDFIYFSPLEDFSWFPFGRIYGIVTKNKMRIVKRIVKSEKADHYLLLSTNPDKDSYPDQDIPADMIERIFEVKFVIKNLSE